MNWLSAALLTALWLPAAAAADEPWLWPVEGAGPGEGILYRPQSYVGSELNFADLFIGAPLGARILAPTDATVTYVGLDYSESLTRMTTSGGVDFSKPLEEQVEAFVAGSRNPKIRRRCVNHSIALKTADGRKIHISGLELAHPFRTGERVARGELLGTMRYAYRLIEEPSIRFSVSTRGGKCDDPMTPLGLATTFVAPQELKPVTELTADEAREDVGILLDAFAECYPSLDDLIAPDELAALRRSLEAEIDGTLSIKRFGALMRRIKARLHDSHVSCWREDKANSPSFAYYDVMFGRLGDSVAVYMTSRGFEQYRGRRITAVDGIPADSVVRFSAGCIAGYDAAVEDYIRYLQFGTLDRIYAQDHPAAAEDGSMTLTFADGEELRIGQHRWRGEPVEFTPSLRDFITINSYRDRNFDMRMIDDSTAYLGLATFSLDEVETDSVRRFIAAHHATPNLIVDVRNNPGGDVEVLNRILSFCTDTAYVATRQYNRVTRRGGFASFRHALNYMEDMELFGEEFLPEPDGAGFRTAVQTEALQPDTVAHYGGRLYVLVNENSCSAATLFPAAVMRSHRGLIVGRETRTAYHYMTALKFADIRLPHSRYVWRIPLVRCVWDDTVNPRIPYGRGVIPDCPVPLTYAEIASTDGDAILNRTLELIAEGVYLGDDPFREEPAPSGWSRPTRLALVLFIAVALGAAGVAAWRRRKK